MATQPNKPRSGFSVETARFPLAALGIFGLLAGLGAWLVQGEFGLLPRILIAAGVLLIGIYIALDPEDVWSKLTGRGALYSGNTVAIAVAAIVILALFNVLGSRYQTKADLTANHQFTLSDESVKLAEALPQPVQVTGWLTSNDSRKQDFQTLLNDYQSKSGGKLTYDLQRSRGPPGRRGRGWHYGHWHDRVSDGRQEADQHGHDRKGHRHRPGQARPAAEDAVLHDRSRRAFARWHRPAGLRHDQAEPDRRQLHGHAPQPADAACGARRCGRGGYRRADRPFLQEELDALKAYVEGGGKLLILVGPNSKTDLSSILQNFQVGFSGNVVVDPAKSVPQDPRVVVVTATATVRSRRICAI